MKIEVNNRELFEAVSTVSKAVSTKTAIPVLEGILIKTNHDKITLIGFDLELGIQTEIEAKVIDFNEADKKISLSMKALLPEPEPSKENTEDISDVNIEEYAKKMEEENAEN